ncbi:MAG: hypothetical protein HKN47_20020 [Pirellulaceae bacterium]|nr:hypothetical protein [Pirellulaceae bacterium]
MSNKTPNKQTTPSNPAKPTQPPSADRPQSANNAQAKQAAAERRQNRGGIRAGGRREADQATKKRMAQASRIWFGLSLVLTILIMIWTFSVPFRTDKPIFAWDKSDMPERPLNISEDILSHPEHDMDDETYRAYAHEMERDLQEQLAKRQRVSRNLPGAEHAARVTEKTMVSMKSELRVLTELEKEFEGGFPEDSIEYQAMENLRRKLSESDG